MRSRTSHELWLCLGLIASIAVISFGIAGKLNASSSRVVSAKPSGGIVKLEASDAAARLSKESR